MALDLNSIETGTNVQLWARLQHQDRLLATLNNQIPQVRMDLAFGCNEKVKFSVIGNGSVYLSGYFIPTENEHGLENGTKNGQTEDKQKKKNTQSTQSI